MAQLEGKVALVTGAASGIGRAVVERFIEEGARVGVFDLAEDRLQQLCRDHPADVVPIVGDVRLFADNVRAVETTVSAFGKLDIFVGNAGVFDGFSRLSDLAPEEIESVFDHLFAINVKGYLFGAKAALPALIQTGGTMIFTLSQASFYPDGGGPIYTASKHAGLGLVRELAFELAPDVRVNGVAPGGTITDLSVPPMLRERVKTVSQEERRRRIASRNPLGIAMDPVHHVGAYVLLASDQARAITGEVIRSDGGLGVRGMGQ